MALRSSLTLTVAAAAVVAGGAGGYLLSEAWHGDAGVPQVEASLDARAGDGTREVRLPAEDASAPESPTRAVGSKPEEQPQPPTRPARTPDTRQAPAPPLPSPEPDTPRPVAVPTLTSTVPVATGDAGLPNAAPVELPAFAPPVRQVELVVPADSVIGVRLDEPLSSAKAVVEDRVTAVVTRDVIVDGRTAIPAGSRVEGYVTLVERGGKFRDKARIGVVFRTIVIAGTTQLPIATEPIFRDGEAPGGEATAKIGASAVVGTVLGAIIGGKKGAAIGGAAGAAGGTAVVAAGGTNDAVIAAGSSLTIRLTEPVTVTIDRDPDTTQK